MVPTNSFIAVFVLLVFITFAFALLYLSELTALSQQLFASDLQNRYPTPRREQVK